MVVAQAVRYQVLEAERTDPYKTVTCYSRGRRYAQFSIPVPAVLICERDQRIWDLPSEGCYCRMQAHSHSQFYARTATCGLLTPSRTTGALFPSQRYLFLLRKMDCPL